MTKIEAAWLAGLIEGEGCFQIDPRPECRFPSARITVSMCDEDVVRKACEIAGCGSVMGPYSNNQTYRKNYKQWKPVWMWSVGKKEEVLAIANQIKDHLGRRRSERLDELIEACNAPPRRPKKSREGIQMPRGENHANSKLRDSDIINIRAIYAYTKASQQRIADIYGVSRELIGGIVRGDRWQHSTNVPWSKV